MEIPMIFSIAYPLTMQVDTWPELDEQGLKGSDYVFVVDT